MNPDFTLASRVAMDRYHEALIAAERNHGFAAVYAAQSSGRPGLAALHRLVLNLTWHHRPRPALGH